MPRSYDNLLDYYYDILHPVDTISRGGLWDLYDNQLSSVKIEPANFKFTGNSYYDIFLRNSFRLSNPNNTEIETISSISRSDNTTLFRKDNEDIDELLSSYRKSFIAMLKAKSSNDDDTDAYDLLKELLFIHSNKTKLWIQDIFNEYCPCEDIVVGLLRLFQEFDFMDVSPVAETIAAACKNHKSYAVKSATLSLLGHWCNRQALNIIETFEEPHEILLSIKYSKLKDIITSKCTI